MKIFKTGEREQRAGRERNAGRKQRKKIPYPKKAEISVFKAFFNMKIAAKILTGFFLIAFLSTAMGIFAASSLKEVSASSKKMFANMLLPSKAVAEVTQLFQKSCNSIRQSLLLDEDDSMLLAVVSSATNSQLSIEQKLLTIEALIPPENADTFAAVREAYDTFEPLLQKAADDVMNANKAVVIKDLTEFGELSLAENDLQKKLDELMYAISGDAAAISSNSNKTGDLVLVITMAAIGAVLVLSLLIGIFISRGISRPITKLTQDISKLASGETDIEMDDKTSRDEVGRMREATRTIMNAIKGLEEDTGILIGAAMEGKLAVRADSAKHQGTYRRIVEGINATLDAMIAPIQESAEVLGELAKGNLSASIKSEFRGDFEMMKLTLNHTIETLQGYIGDITNVLGQMSEGILTVRIKTDYAGDFEGIKVAINKSVEAFHSVLSEINAAAGEVSTGTEQVSGSGQSISMGATAQASALEQLSAAITEISAQTRQNAERAREANELSFQARESALNGNSKMKTLLGAMEEISEASARISKIIKVIDDIAFQTNILALNAAVEAARAGSYGKGFAVVAEEVRNLAERSTRAAQETAVLIEGSMNKTKAGAETANITASAFAEIIESVETTVNLSEKIATASSEQAAGINQINTGIKQLSDVVQSNSANAQEMAATSQQISGQAALLMDMVDRFVLEKRDQYARTEKTVLQIGP